MAGVEKTLNWYCKTAVYSVLIKSNANVICYRFSFQSSSLCWRHQQPQFPAKMVRGVHTSHWCETHFTFQFVMKGTYSKSHIMGNFEFVWFDSFYWFINWLIVWFTFLFFVGLGSFAWRRLRILTDCYLRKWTFKKDPLMVPRLVSLQLSVMLV